MAKREKEVRRHAAESARPQASTVAPAAVLNASLGAWSAAAGAAALTRTAAAGAAGVMKRYRKQRDWLDPII